MGICSSLGTPKVADCLSATCFWHQFIPDIDFYYLCCGGNDSGNYMICLLTNEDSGGVGSVSKHETTEMLPSLFRADVLRS